MLSSGQMSCERCRRIDCVQTGFHGEDLEHHALLCACECHERTEAEREAEDRADRLDAAYEQSFAQLLEEGPWV